MSGKPRSDDGCHRCCWPWDRAYFVTRGRCRAHQFESGVRNQRGACIRNQRHRSGREMFEHLLQTNRFVVVVITEQRSVDFITVEQFPSVPCVFGGDDVHFTKHAQCPKRNIFQIADRRRDQIERSHARILAERSCRVFIVCCRGRAGLIAADLAEGKLD